MYMLKLYLCSYVLMELVETERDYVRDLGSVVEVRKDAHAWMCVCVCVCERVLCVCV